MDQIHPSCAAATWNMRASLEIRPLELACRSSKDVSFFELRNGAQQDTCDRLARAQSLVELQTSMVGREPLQLVCPIDEQGCEHLPAIADECSARCEQNIFAGNRLSSPYIRPHKSEIIDGKNLRAEWNSGHGCPREKKSRRTCSRRIDFVNDDAECGKCSWLFTTLQTASSPSGGFKYRI